MADNENDAQGIRVGVLSNDTHPFIAFVDDEGKAEILSQLTPEGTVIVLEQLLAAAQARAAAVQAKAFFANLIGRASQEPGEGEQS